MEPLARGAKRTQKSSHPTAKTKDLESEGDCLVVLAMKAELSLSTMK
jgi:hypothetical protein